jgi:hypothetical protein
MLSELHFTNDNNAELLSCNFLSRISCECLRPHVFRPFSRRNLVHAEPNQPIAPSSVKYQRTVRTASRRTKPVSGSFATVIPSARAQSVHKSAGPGYGQRIFITDVNCFKAILHIRTLQTSAPLIARTIGRGQQEKIQSPKRSKPAQTENLITIDRINHHVPMIFCGTEALWSAVDATNA